MKNIFSSTLISILAIFTCNSCSTIPKGAKVVTPFNSEKYLGTWYEIARMDFRFERNMNNVTATYSVNTNGTIQVDNRGFNYVTKEWKQAIGKAKLAGAPNEGKLKVSFFGPFYAAYNIIALDNEYKYVLVAGKNLDYLWILSRETTIPEEIKQKYLSIAEQIGFNIKALIWVEHTKK